MSEYTYLRIIIGLVASGMAILLVVRLATGSTNGWLRATRLENPKAYWTGLALQAGTVITFGAAAAFAPDRRLGLAIGASAIGTNLAVGLVSRFVERPDEVWPRGYRPLSSWGWLALSLFLVLALAVFLVLD